MYFDVVYWHPLIDDLFSKMLKERIANADHGASYEICDIAGEMDALLDAVKNYYGSWAVAPIEELVKEYSGKTVGELYSRLDEIKKNLQLPSKDVLDKIPVDYTEDRSLKKVVTHSEELAWKSACYTKDYEATKEFVDPIVQTIAKRMAMASFIEGCLRSLPADQIIDEDMEYFLLEVARYVGIFMESDFLGNAEYWVDSCHTVISEATQKVMDAHREEIEQYRNSQMALKKRLG